MIPDTPREPEERSNHSHRQSEVFLFALCNPQNVHIQLSKALDPVTELNLLPLFLESEDLFTSNGFFKILNFSLGKIFPIFWQIFRAYPTHGAV